MIVEKLNNASGIQYNGLKDNTESSSLNPLTTALIIGSFKRGRTDRPMFIDSSNIKALLGYDPKNPDYIAVQGAIDASNQSVMVLRVASSSQKCTKSITIDCDCTLPENSKLITIDCVC